MQCHRILDGAGESLSEGRWQPGGEARRILLVEEGEIELVEFLADD
jgi:hypothetical protein